MGKGPRRLVDTIGGLPEVLRVSQLFIRREQTRKIELIIKKITDDLLWAGSVHDMECFAEEIGRRLETRKAIIDSEISFNATTIIQNMSSDITMSVEAFMAKIRPIEIHAPRRKMPLERSNDKDIGLYRALAGGLIWLGCAVMP